MKVLPDFGAGPIWRRSTRRPKMDAQLNQVSNENQHNYLVKLLKMMCAFHQFKVKGKK